MPRSSIAAALVLAGSVLVPMNARADDAGLPKAEVEKIVREYLLREPEIIYQAIQELQKRQQAAEATRQQEMIVSHADDIFRHADDPIAGNADGDVTVVEFFDYHCGYCRSMVGSLRDLVAADEQIRFVFKELPVLGADSVTAAKAALAASKLDDSKYYDFHVALMQSKDLSVDTVLELAAAKGYDPEAVRAEMGADWIRERLAGNQSLAQTLGINGTPSFVVGKTLIPGAVDVGRLAQLVQDERKAAP
jgi:protein-disulfide isomerase